MRSVCFQRRVERLPNLERQEIVEMLVIRPTRLMLMMPESSADRVAARLEHFGRQRDHGLVLTGLPPLH